MNEKRRAKGMKGGKKSASAMAAQKASITPTPSQRKSEFWERMGRVEAMRSIAAAAPAALRKNSTSCGATMATMPLSIGMPACLSSMTGVMK